MKNRIMTLHPEGKQGVNVEKEKYEVIKTAILEILREENEIGFKALGKKVKERLSGKFDGSISWYYTTIKLDLEARGVIERIPGSKPQALRMKN